MSARRCPASSTAPMTRHTIRSDYVENSNDSYWLANPSAPFPAYSPIIGHVDVRQGLRTRLGNHDDRPAGGRHRRPGPAKFTVPTLQAMWENDRSLLAELVLRPLVSSCRATPEVTATDGTTVNLVRACDALAGYDSTGNLDASGGWLFSVWYAGAPSSPTSGLRLRPRPPPDDPVGSRYDQSGRPDGPGRRRTPAEVPPHPADRTYGTSSTSPGTASRSPSRAATRGASTRSTPPTARVDHSPPHRTVRSTTVPRW